ncbi:MAG: ATP-dependent helicase, partial [Nocardioides sp.]
MSFVPVTGPATFRAADPPRESVVEFTDARRTVALPIRAALPVLTKSHTRDDLHPSVGLLSGAVLLAMRLVAAGKFEPAPTALSWQVTPLDADDTDRVSLLAQSRAHEELDAEAAEVVVRQVLDAVVDAMPRSAPVSTRRTLLPRSTARAGAAGDRFTERLQARIAHHRGA